MPWYKCGSQRSRLWHLFCLTLRYDHPVIGLVCWDNKGPDGSEDHYTRCQRLAAVHAEFWLDAGMAYLGISLGYFPVTWRDWVLFSAALSCCSSVVKLVVVGFAAMFFRRSVARQSKEKLSCCQRLMKRLARLMMLYLLVIALGIAIFLYSQLGKTFDQDQAMDCVTDGGCKVQMFPAAVAVPQLFGEAYTPSPETNHSAPHASCPRQPVTPAHRWTETWVPPDHKKLVGDAPVLTLCSAFWDAGRAMPDAVRKVSGYGRQLFDHFLKLSSSSAACRVESNSSLPGQAFEVVTNEDQTSCSFCMTDDPDTPGLTLLRNTTCGIERLGDVDGRICVCTGVEANFTMIIIGGCISLVAGWLILDPLRNLLLARFWPCCYTELCFSINPCYKVAYEQNWDDEVAACELTQGLTTPGQDRLNITCPR
eukprot:TRINITY_DN40735_c0_g1_i1.p1 TRINITY_DN40735_c0_g1~~TRINITY_DN40735_c0_g1_i1.p1  ORF type:complete len:451 (+),score=94.07 TRINITY_DN40735_c0_g1_i1:87-1355(+)